MAMLEENVFARENVFPSWFANAVQKFLSTAAPSFQITRASGTTIQVVAGAGVEAAVISINGNWRWNEATVNRAHPGGAAGTWDIYAVAAANSIVNVPAVGTDATVRTFALRIVEAGKTPPIEAGTVDIFRKIGSLLWTGAEVIGISQIVGGGPEGQLKPGDLKFTHRTVVDVNYIKAEGQELSRTVYAVLWKAMGEPNTGNGTTTFNAPDHRGRSPMGAGTGAGLTARVLNALLGSELVKLTVGQLAKHAHPGSAGNSIMQNNGPEHFKVEGAGFGVGAVGSTGEAGGDEAHPNVHPVTVVNVWVRVF